MRLLPATPRRTWLLAAAAWLGGCGVIWSLLPDVPRVVVPYMDAGLPHGFTADGRGLYGCGYGSFVPPRDLIAGRLDDPAPNGPYRVWDLETGRTIVSVPESIGTRRSLLDRSAVVLSGDGPAEPDYLLDPVTGRREHPPWSAPVSASEVRLTVDGRYVLFPEPAGICWWDRQSKQVVGTFPGLTPVDLAADGRWITVNRAAGPDEPTRVAVRKAASDEVLTQVDLHEGYDSAWFSEDGGYLLIRAEGGVQVIELPSGRVCLSRLAGLRFYVLPALNQVVAEEQSDGDSSPLVRWDLPTGRRLGRCRIPDGFWPTDPVQMPRSTFILLEGPGRTGLAATIADYLVDVPVLGRSVSPATAAYSVFDLAADREVARVYPSNPWLVERAPDGQTVINASRDGQLEFWDVPPRKPLWWLAVAAAVWAMPVAWFARRRVRRLGAGVVA